MAWTRARCLTCFIVMTLWATATADSWVEQLHFITAQPGRRHRPPPCPPQPGVHWVRDPSSCSSYFICVASRPIRMVPCPHSTVWSVGARNCVPVHSLWDDCTHLPPGPAPSASSTQPSRHWTAASDSMSALVDPLHPEEERRENLLRASLNLFVRVCPSDFVCLLHTQTTT